MERLAVSISTVGSSPVARGAAMDGRRESAADGRSLRRPAAAGERRPASGTSFWRDGIFTSHHAAVSLYRGRRRGVEPVDK